jgi:hypothetical protein
MSNIKILADLIQMTNTLERELKFQHLTTNDKQVLSAIVLLSDDEGDNAHLNDLKNHQLICDIPLPTLYKSLKHLIQVGLVTKIGTERSGIYQLLKI